MTAIALSEHAPLAASRAGEPLYFHSGERRLFGWLHWPAAAGSADLGLVICKPFGYESICAHRGVRAFAQAAASVGLPTLRFDYLGTGDSEDGDATADQLAEWTDNILAAVRELRSATGVQRVCLLGFRLGALLATLAASRCEEIAALIAIAPVISGRRYLRELRVIQMAASQAVIVDPRAALANEDTSGGGPSMEVSGFSLGSAATASLLQLDLMALSSAPTRHALVIDRADVPGARGWADVLTNLGVQTEYMCQSGMVEMMWTAPHFAAVPEGMVMTVREWLARLQKAISQDGYGAAQTLPPAVPAAAVPAPGERPSAALCLRDAPSDDPTVIERPVFLGEDPRIFGIVAEPQSGELRRRGVILLNDGATYHIGANRLYVSLARRWASRGYTVLRMDLAGLGDSTTRQGRPGNEVFPPGAMQDIRLAVDYLRSRYRVQDITIGGLCAGAYHALRAALEPLPVQCIVMVNPQVFFWKEDMTVEDLQVAEVVRKRVLSAYWRRLITGKVNIWKVTKIYMRRPWLELESVLRNLARRLRIRLPNDLGWQLEEIAGRGVRIVFAFSRGDVGIELLRLEGGSSVKRLGSQCRIHIIDGADHIFSQRGPRQELENVLSEELYAPNSARRPQAVQVASAPGH